MSASLLPFSPSLRDRNPQAGAEAQRDGDRMLKDHLLKELPKLLKGHGFARKKNTWHRETDDGIDVFDIQASRWETGDFYLNVGVYVGELREPNIVDCTRYSSRVERDGRTTQEAVADALAYWEKIHSELRDQGRRAPVAQRVIHPTFGPGTVVSSKDDLLEVRFDSGETRKLKKRFVSIVQSQGEGQV